MIAVSQLLDVFMDNVEKKVSIDFIVEKCTLSLLSYLQTAGYMIEPNKRYAENVRGREGRRIIKAHTICNQCMSSIVRHGKMAEPLIIYQCAHQFHSSCLTEKQKELGNKKCPICLKHSYLAIREEREKLEQRQRKRTGRRPGRQNVAAEAPEEDENEGSIEVGAKKDTRSFNDDFGEGVGALNSASLMHRKLEQYDSLLGEVSLQLSQFEEEMVI